MRPKQGNPVVDRRIGGKHSLRTLHRLTCLGGKADAVLQLLDSRYWRIGIAQLLINSASETTCLCEIPHRHAKTFLVRTV